MKRSDLETDRTRAASPGATPGPHHRPAKAWLEDALSGDETVGFAWLVLLGFIRSTTNRQVFPNPLAVDDAIAIVDSWLDRPNAHVLAAGEQHWPILRELLAHAGAAANLTTDAHLASLAIEHGAELCSTDPDFARFRQLRWRNPLTRKR
jgi:toxin-antitoxin system PIN domain toxin